MNQHDIAAEARRLVILQCLKTDADYKMSDVLLHTVLKSSGHGVPLDVLRTDIAWLERNRLLATQQLPGCTVVVLRNDGVDVAEGTAVVPGVARPLPE